MPEPQVERELYNRRFSDDELARARAFWKPICRYLQQHVDAEGTTLDLGAGYCHFINNIESRRRIALDVNGENLRRWAGPDVQCVEASGVNLGAVDTGSVNTVFASNVYEHFHSREDVAASLAEVFRVLVPGGRFIVLQPNFRYCMKEYHDFFDHRLIFNHRSMAEGIGMSGFRVDRVTPQFLPYSSKGKLPTAPWLVAAYLAIPLAWRVLGAQMLIVATRPS